MTSYTLIHTDGSCFTSDHGRGPGGWAAVFTKNGVQKVLYGSEPSTTNNRMELKAAIEALNHLDRPCNVSVYSDSQYVQKGISLWMAKWKRNGWRNAKKKPISNKDLWMQLEEAQSRHLDVIWNWVKGHGEDVNNNIADKYAGEAAYEQKPKTLKELK